ncbi:MAG TPA: acyl-CoA dehydrogenase family protein [Acidimicrobiia bacterium]|nr:acyl-CoA dehydrogenase family protein [Acidimicrobiia bacterium]
MQFKQPRRPVRRTDPADEEALLGVIGRWLDHEVAPQVAQLEDDDVWPAEMVEQMRSFGLFGAVIDPAWGGLGLSASTYAKVVSRISEVWMSLTGIFNSHLMLAILVETFGSDDLKKRFLPRLCSGELRGGLALTEPDCGTDLSAVRTRAVRDGDRYLVDGTKTWISNGLYGEVFAALVRTDPGADPPRRGLSMFVMEKGPGFSASRKLPKLGYRGIDAAELVFSEFSVPAANRIGDEGQGFYLAVSGLELGRINVAARGVGIARRALDEALRYAQQRRTFGKPICEHQAIQLKLGEMATRAEAARLLTEAAAAAYDRGERCDLEAGMAKYFASEAAMENATEAMRIHGGYGYSKEFPVERLYRDAPLLCIGEGTNEMQRIIIARQLVERNRIP